MNILLGVWLTLAAGDAVTGHVGLNRGAHELFMTQNPWVNDSIVAGEAATVVVGVEKLKHDHPKLTKGIIIGAIAFRGVVVVHNIHVIQKVHQ